jgi:glycosyltransferase involved in cell wall biosynthesis
MPLEAASLPTVTIILPVRNEAAFIQRCLGAILDQDYPPECLNVLVADGQSDDDTVTIIEAMATNGRVKVIPNPARIQSAGLNLLIQQATGDYVIRVDGHTIIAPDYVRQCVIALQETGAWNVGGAMDPVGITHVGRAIAAAGKSAFAVPTAFHVSRTPTYTDTVYLGAWPRWVFDRVGSYREDFVANEDYELNVRIRAAGGKIYFTPRIRSVYYGRQTLGALWRQYHRYGQSKVRTLREHPQSLRLRHLAAPLFVAGLLIGLPLAALHPVFAGLYAAGLAAYTALNLAFSVRVASRAGWELLPLLPLVFLTIHLAWGSGFWRGVLSQR